jgi:hypothetical protein
VGIQRIAVLIVFAVLGAPAGAQDGAAKPDRFAACDFSLEPGEAIKPASPDVARQNAPTSSS